jgi:glycosyltransferase involved in cell wall biosynthesis
LRVYGWSNAAGGVHHYRIREPLRGLSIRGHQTRSLPVANLEAFEQWDVVLVRGLHNPRNSMLWRWAAQSGKPALRVYDLDDDIWAWPPGTKEYDYWTDERRLNVELNIQCADLVTTPTHSLAEILAELNPRVAVLPNTIPDKLLHLLPQRRDKFIIGWQGAHQHVIDLQLIYNPVLRFMLRHSNVEFHLWGPHGTLDFPDALANRIITFPWTSRVWDHYLRLNMDIGLAPINMGERFNETKSDIRLREYAALGIPFIASAGTTYANTALAARGMLADTEDEWEEALEQLYRKPNLRYWMSEQGRLRARLWTTEDNGKEWESAYVRARNARNLRESAEGNGQPIASKLVSADGTQDRAIADVQTSRL